MAFQNFSLYQVKIQFLQKLIGPELFQEGQNENVSPGKKLMKWMTQLRLNTLIGCLIIYGCLQGTLKKIGHQVIK